MSSCIDQSLYTELTLTPDQRVKVPTCLLYEPHDPYAVHIVFYTDTDEPVTWAFARDLLAQGILRPSGERDVRLWPTYTGPDAVLNLALSSPHGTAHLTASLSVVTQWLERTYHLVPSGQEGDGIDLNAELSRLLHGPA